jgi:conserved oligomeric Golgi complex subunit 8
MYFLENHHLYKTIEITRVNLFSILTQYKAVFNDDEHSPFAPNKHPDVNQSLIFFSWIRDKVT